LFFVVVVVVVVSPVKVVPTNRSRATLYDGESSTRLSTIGRILFLLRRARVLSLRVTRSAFFF
jgi:hypothetical protein